MTQKTAAGLSVLSALLLLHGGAPPPPALAQEPAEGIHVALPQTAEGLDPPPTPENKEAEANELPAIPLPPKTGDITTEQVATLTAKEAAALRKEADRAYVEGELTEAIALYSRLLSFRPEDIQARIALGRSQNFLNQQDAAIATYEKVFKRAPETPNVRTWLAELQMAKRNRAEAERWLKEELEARPDSAWALSWVASLHLESGDHQGAFAEFKRAGALDPRVAEQRHQNGTALRSRGLHRRALTEFAAATWLNPSAAGPYFGVAACYGALDDHASALKWYERYLYLDSTSEWSRVVREEMANIRASTN